MQGLCDASLPVLRRATKIPPTHHPSISHGIAIFAAMDQSQRCGLRARISAPAPGRTWRGCSRRARLGVERFSARARVRRQTDVCKCKKISSICIEHSAASSSKTRVAFLPARRAARFLTKSSARWRGFNMGRKLGNEARSPVSCRVRTTPSRGEGLSRTFSPPWVAA